MSHLCIYYRAVSNTKADASEHAKKYQPPIYGRLQLFKKSMVFVITAATEKV
jgi:hypothetical protein